MRRVLIAAVPLVILTGCAGDPDATPATETVTVTATVTAEPEASTEPAGGDAPEVEPEVAAVDDMGTRSEPLAAGSTVTVGDWSVTVGATNLDASAEIAAENSFNDPPSDGHAFVMVPVDLTYLGEGSDTPWVSLSFTLVGGDGNVYDERCGVTPSSVRDISEMFNGASASGNVCAEVAESALEGAAWRITESFSFDDAEAWVALTE